MKLTRAAEHSIMILFYLAKAERRFAAAELSKILAVPINHLYKLIRVLARGGYINTFQGKIGGVELKKMPAKITLLEIIEQIEGPIYISNCVLGDKVCNLTRNCALKIKLGEAQKGLIKVLGSTTVADLINPDYSHKRASLTMLPE